MSKAADDLKWKQAAYYNEEKALKKQVKQLHKKAGKGKFEIADFACERCRGQRHCIDCGGSGEIPRPAGLMTGLRSVTRANTMMKCPFCNGSGICRLCEGAGSYPQRRAVLSS